MDLYRWLNRLDILDPALLRPGRFDRMIEFPLPNAEGRAAIFKIHTRKLRLLTELNIKILVERTEGATGADIKAICTEAGMFAIRKEADYVTQEDFIKAIDKVLNKAIQKPFQSRLYS